MKRFQLHILDWYIIRKFLGTFFFTIALIVIIAVIFDLSEKIDDFLETMHLSGKLYSIIT